MKNVVIDSNILEGIKIGKIVQIILDIELNNKEKIILNNDIQVEITSKAIYKNIKECFKVIPMDLFGIKIVDEATNKYGNYDKIYAYRIKYDNNIIEDIYDSKLLDIIDVNTLVKNNIGHSNTNVYEVKTRDGKNAILKVQTLSNRNDLYDEYQRIKWMQDKCKVPEIYYYNEINNTKYLLMQKLMGTPAHKYDNCAYDMGSLLKKIHNIDITDCPFKQNSVDVLLEKVLDNIDIIVSQVQESYPDMNKSDIISFIKNNIPDDKVLVHGDYSLPNIIIGDNGEIGVIDLGDLSISTKYFDFYYLKKSMARNKKIEQFPELLNGYGIDTLNDNYMKWIEIVDKVLF